MFKLFKPATLGAKIEKAHAKAQKARTLIAGLMPARKSFVSVDGIAFEVTESLFTPKHWYVRVNGATHLFDKNELRKVEAFA